MEFDFEALVTVTSICNSLTICAEFGCLIRLRYERLIRVDWVSYFFSRLLLIVNFLLLFSSGRYIEPDTYRPFKIPGGNWLVWVLFFFIVVLFTAFIGFTPWPYILICGGVNLFFVGTYFLKLLWLKYAQEKFIGMMMIWRWSIRWAFFFFSIFIFRFQVWLRALPVLQPAGQWRSRTGRRHRHGDSRRARGRR